jgi:hypothetical protein
MTDDLRRLIDMARTVKMSPEEREEQRQSFAYGNTHIENENITRETIARAAEEMRAHG